MLYAISLMSPLRKAQNHMLTLNITHMCLESIIPQLSSGNTVQHKGALNVSMTKAQENVLCFS